MVQKLGTYETYLNPSYTIFILKHLQDTFIGEILSLQIDSAMRNPEYSRRGNCSSWTYITDWRLSNKITIQNVTNPNVRHFGKLI